MKFLPEQRPISAFGDGGFRFGDHSHRGDLLILPSGMRAWDGEDYSGIFSEVADLDFVIIGTGAGFQRISSTLAQQFATAGLSADAMATAAAVRTYNLMLGDARRVAAALRAVP